MKRTKMHACAAPAPLERNMRAWPKPYHSTLRNRRPGWSVRSAGVRAAFLSFQRFRAVRAKRAAAPRISYLIPTRPLRHLPAHACT